MEVVAQEAEQPACNGQHIEHGRQVAMQEAHVGEDQAGDQPHPAGQAVQPVDEVEGVDHQHDPEDGHHRRQPAQVHLEQAIEADGFDADSAQVGEPGRGELYGELLRGLQALEIVEQPDRKGEHRAEHEQQVLGLHHERPGHRGKEQRGQAQGEVEGDEYGGPADAWNGCGVHLAPVRLVDQAAGRGQPGEQRYQHERQAERAGEDEQGEQQERVQGHGSLTLLVEGVVQGLHLRRCGVGEAEGDLALAGCGDLVLEGHGDGEPAAQVQVPLVVFVLGGRHGEAQGLGRGEQLPVGGQDLFQGFAVFSGVGREEAGKGRQVFLFVGRGIGVQEGVDALAGLGFWGLR